MNKNLIVRIILLFVVVFAAFQAVSADPYTVLIHPDTKPFKYLDDKGEFAGIDPELLAVIAAEGGFEYELVSQDFDKLLSDVSECKADAAISAISVTEDREQNVKFSSPYLISNQHIFVKSELADEISLESEKIVKVGVKRSTTAETNVNEVAEKDGLTVSAYSDYAAVFAALDAGEVDAVVADEYLAKPFSDGYDVMVIGDPLSVERYAVAVCPEKTELLEQINKGLDAARDKGILELIVLDNLSK